MSNLTKIISFGTRHGAPPTDCTVIDVRQFFPANPWHDKSLRSLTGLDPRVADDIQQAPHYLDSYQRLKAAVLAAKKPTVALGCTGGKHRSVYFATILGQELGIPVEHRDIKQDGLSQPVAIGRKGNMMTWNLYQKDEQGRTVVAVKDSSENVDGFEFVREATDGEVDDEIGRRTQASRDALSGL